MDIKAGKRKIRISLFDIVILILIVALAAGFVVLKNRGGENKGASELTYEIELANLDASMEGAIHKNDRFIDKVKRFDMGEVVDVEYLPYKDFSYDNVNHRKVYTEVPGKISAYITMKSAYVDEGNVIKTAGGLEVAVGVQVSVIGPGYSGAGYIVAIDRGDD